MNGQNKAAILVELFGSVLRILEKKMGKGNLPFRRKCLERYLHGFLPLALGCFHRWRGCQRIFPSSGGANKFS